MMDQDLRRFAVNVSNTKVDVVPVGVVNMKRGVRVKAKAGIVGSYRAASDSSRQRR